MDLLKKKYGLVSEKVRTCLEKSTDLFSKKYGLVYKKKRII